MSLSANDLFPKTQKIEALGRASLPHALPHPTTSPLHLPCWYVPHLRPTEGLIPCPTRGALHPLGKESLLSFSPASLLFLPFLNFSHPKTKNSLQLWHFSFCPLSLLPFRDVSLMDNRRAGYACAPQFLTSWSLLKLLLLDLRTLLQPLQSGFCLHHSTEMASAKSTRMSML